MRKERQTADKITTTICWHCKNAVPKIVNGRYVRGCECSIYKQPVPGWDAQKFLMNYNFQLRTTYEVHECPKFEKG